MTERDPSNVKTRGSGSRSPSVSDDVDGAAIAATKRSKVDSKLEANVGAKLEAKRESSGELVREMARESKGFSKKPKPSRADQWKRARAALWRWTKRLALMTVMLAVASILGFWLMVQHYEEDLPSVADLKGHYHPAQTTRVLAKDGTLLAEIYTERRTVISIASLPPHVKLAFLAAEDANFYEHDGLNYWGIARAMLVNLKSGRFKQGGSTITQQVVKNLILDQEKTFRRKIREALLARRLEQELSKDEILELYLNQIYFGDGRYGVEEAARNTFGKSAKDLTTGEAALLAGTVAGPEPYNPHKHLDKALQRRDFVLGQMHQKKFLNDAQYEAAKAETTTLAVAIPINGELAPEAVELAKRMLHEVAPDEEKLGGFTITTSIDPKLQTAARKALRDALVGYDKRKGVEGPMKPPPQPTTDKKGHVIKPPPPKEPPFTGAPSFDQHKVLIGEVASSDDVAGTFDVTVGTARGVVKLADYMRYNPADLPPSKFAPAGALVRVSLLGPVLEAKDASTPPVRVPLRLESGPEGAFVVIDVRSRQIVALIGNYEAASGGLDRATQSKRQPGSTFKPIVYSYGLRSRAFTPATLMDPNPEIFPGGYKPSNYEGWTGKDQLRLREALANSVNVVAVRVLSAVGPANVVSYAQSLGIRSTMKPDLSLALGSYEISPSELCGAYATFAAGGLYDEPRLVTKIVGPDGKERALPEMPPPRRVLDESEAYITTNMLTSVVDHGTAARARSLGRPLAGKTGTSNAAKDTWFAGYSTEIAAVVWIGYDDGKSLGAGETGASTALPAWIDFMKVAHEKKPASDFPRPAGIVTVRIDRKTGKLPPEGDEDVMDEVFLAGTEPTEVVELPSNPYESDAGADATP